MHPQQEQQEQTLHIGNTTITFSPQDDGVVLNKAILNSIDFNIDPIPTTAYHGATCVSKGQVRLTDLPLWTRAQKARQQQQQHLRKQYQEQWEQQW